MVLHCSHYQRNREDSEREREIGKEKVWPESDKTKHVQWTKQNKQKKHLVTVARVHKVWNISNRSHSLFLINLSQQQLSWEHILCFFFDKKQLKTQSFIITFAYMCVCVLYTLEDLLHTLYTMTPRIVCPDVGPSFETLES